MDENLDLGISFDLPKNQSNVIKAIGVGGGGSNAINHMYSCLLYTSPSPRDMRRSRMPSSA